MKNSQISLDPKDLLVILELGLSRAVEGPSTYLHLAEILGMSVSQVHGAVQRLILAGLVAPQGLKGPVNRKGLLDFLLHGARYVFPAVFGRPARGIRTGASSDLFASSHLVKEGEVWVWPSPEGKDRGISLAPVHPSALKAIARDPELHKALVHFDALRGGQARERQAAEAYFKQAFA